MKSKLPKDKYIDAVKEKYWDLLEQDSAFQVEYKYEAIKRWVPET